MELGYAGNEVNIDWDLVLSSYPDLSFHLSYTQITPLEIFVEEGGMLNARSQEENVFSLYGPDIRSEVELWKNSLDLTGIDILYVYGIGLGHYYAALRPWLSQKRERVVIFLEDRLDVLQAFFQTDQAEEFLKDAQAHVFYVPDPSQWEAVLDESIHRFLGDRIEVSALQSYKSRFRYRFQKIRMKLLRKASVVYAFLTEALNYHLLMKNLIANFAHLPSSFHANRLQGAFKGVPAIICGAGPSLAEAIPYLKQLEQKALIIAGGSTITALSRHGIRPHIAMALDPNHEEYLRLRPNTSFEMPFVYSSRIRRDVFDGLNANLGYLCSDTGGCFESWMHEQMQIGAESLGSDLGMEALSVTTLAVPFAHSLGCNPILFCGVDLAYTGMQRYAPGVMESSDVFLEELKKDKRAMERPLRKKDKQGRPLYTLVKWVMEASCIGEYAKKHSDTIFVNCSEKGLPIPHMNTGSLQDIFEQYCIHSYDLRGKIHAEAENIRLTTISSGMLTQTYEHLSKSLEKCIALMEDMLSEVDLRLARFLDSSLSLESGKMSVLEMDLQEELAYEVLLQLAFPAYERLLERIYPSKEPQESEGYRLNYLQKKKHLWKECLKIARGCSNLMKEYL